MHTVQLYNKHILLEFEIRDKTAQSKQYLITVITNMSHVLKMVMSFEVADVEMTFDKLLSLRHRFKIQWPLCALFKKWSDPTT